MVTFGGQSSPKTIIKISFVSCLEPKTLESWLRKLVQAAFYASDLPIDVAKRLLRLIRQRWPFQRRSVRGSHLHCGFLILGSPDVSRDQIKIFLGQFPSVLLKKRLPPTRRRKT
jgi:hypothetical protein